LKPSIPAHLQTEEEASVPDGPFYLECPYCHWSTLETGIQFEKPNGVFKQLSDIKNGGTRVPPLREREKERSKRLELLDKRRYPEDYRHEDRIKTSEAKLLPPDNTPSKEAIERDEIFSNLAAFYRHQLSKDKNSSDISRHSRYLSRLLSATGKSRATDSKPRSMSEARNVHEGLHIVDPAAEDSIINRIKTAGWDGTLSEEQRHNQLNPSLRFTEELRPIPTLLQTKRTKRCKQCRQILSRPDNKVTSNRYKIKLLALNQIPRVTVRALSAPPIAATSAFSSTSVAQPFNYDALTPGSTIQFLLTIYNPLFDPIKVTLATSATTPGRISSRVTILCPQFDVGANTDVWDEALGDGPAKRSTTSLQSSTGSMQAEAGKIWERGRNWTSVIIEVIPGTFSPLPPAMKAATVKEQGEDGKTLWDDKGKWNDWSDDEADEKEDDALTEDEDVLEIPVFVRCEYETEPGAEERSLDASIGSGGASKGKEKREDAFWCVLGVGRTAL
jgi:dynactin 4